KPLSSTARRASGSEARKPAWHIASTIRSTCSWLREPRVSCAAFAFLRRSRTCWIERRSSSRTENDPDGVLMAYSTPSRFQGGADLPEESLAIGRADLTPLDPEVRQTPGDAPQLRDAHGVELLLRRERFRRRAGTAAERERSGAVVPVRKRSVAGRVAGGENRLDLLMRPRDDVHGYQSPAPLRARRARVGRCFHGAALAADEDRRVAAADLFLADQDDPRRLDHRVGGLDRADEAASLDHA